jgi:hypothetical protein
MAATRASLLVVAVLLLILTSSTLSKSSSTSNSNSNNNNNNHHQEHGNENDQTTAGSTENTSHSAIGALNLWIRDHFAGSHHVVVNDASRHMHAAIDIEVCCILLALYSFHLFQTITAILQIQGQSIGNHLDPLNIKQQP